MLRYRKQIRPKERTNFFSFNFSILSPFHSKTSQLQVELCNQRGVDTTWNK